MTYREMETTEEEGRLILRLPPLEGREWSEEAAVNMVGQKSRFKIEGEDILFDCVGCYLDIDGALIAKFERWKPKGAPIDRDGAIGRDTT